MMTDPPLFDPRSDDDEPLDLNDEDGDEEKRRDDQRRRRDIWLANDPGCMM